MTMTETPTFADFLNQGWADHAEDAAGVFARLPAGLARVDQPAEQLPGWAALVVHVAGEHLGRWDDGLALLAQAQPQAEAGGPAWQALQRGVATLRWCAGREAEAEAAWTAAHGESALPLASTQARVLAVAAAALAGQGALPRAQAAFAQALALVAYGPDADDPAARALAVTGNNLACELEETADRSPAQDALLERAAETARTYWAIAGGWVQVKFAEYRLAMTKLALGRPAEALDHAAAALALCDANDAAPGARFFPYEVLARARHAAGDPAGARAARDQAAAALEHVEAGDREWHAAELAKLDALLG